MVIQLEIEELGRKHGIEKLGFLTLTFKQNVQEIREARRRYNSLCTHVLRKRYVCGLSVVERQVSGRIHFHVLVVLKADIRTGANFSEFKEGQYQSANLALRSEWAFWRKASERYGFGRHELLPIKSTVEAVSCYAGKYISKHIIKREPRDSGARLVTYFNYRPGQRRASPHFAWSTGYSLLWRLLLASWAKRKGFEDMRAVSKVLGPRWAFHRQGEIINSPLNAACSKRWEQWQKVAPGNGCSPCGRVIVIERQEKDPLGVDLPKFSWSATIQGGGLRAGGV